MTKRQAEKAAVMAKEPCRCGVFCLEDTFKTGRYCKLNSEGTLKNPALARLAKLRRKK